MVVGNQATFRKKAVGKIFFTCTEGAFIKEKINLAIETGEGVVIETNTVGKDETGDIVAEFKFIWSVKVKKSKS